MSVVIKGMEMPENCLACKLRGDGSDSKYIWDCPFTAFAYTREEGETGRLDECPLVEVPAPHGRLIDADALIERMESDAEQMEEPLAKMFTYAAINDVKHSESVIKEEGGDAE